MDQEGLMVREQTTPRSLISKPESDSTRHRWYPLVHHALVTPNVWMSGRFMGEGQTLRQLSSSRKSILEMAQQSVVRHGLTGEVVVLTERDEDGIAWVYVLFNPADISDSVIQ